MVGDLAARFFDERWIDAPARPGKRAGAFSASTVPSVHPYVMLNWTGTPPRRAGARARARPRRPPGAGRRARDLPPEHAADGRRDGVGVRRDADVRPPARGDDRRRRRGCRCWPRTSRGRSPPCSARCRCTRSRTSVQRGAAHDRRDRARALRRAVGRVAARAVRRLRRGDRRLPVVVVVRAPLHRLARLRLRVRVRPAARAVGLPALPRGGRAASSRATSRC